MKLLIDGDIVCYRCGFAAERALYTVTDGFGQTEEFDYKKEVDKYIKESGQPLDSFTIEKDKVIEPLEYALKNVRTVLEAIQERFESNDMTVYLSGKDNFRDFLANILPYKGNRDPDHKPVHYEEIVRYICENYHTIICDGAEADDALAIDQTNDSIIVSTDKDLDQIPGQHFNWVSDEIYTIEGWYATRLFWLQVLTGDATDNIQGIPGIGSKKADKILEQVDHMDEYEQVVSDYYQDFYQTNEKGREYCLRYMTEWQNILQENINLIEIGGDLARENIRTRLPHSDAVAAN